MNTKINNIRHKPLLKAIRPKLQGEDGVPTTMKSLQLSSVLTTEGHTKQSAISELSELLI